MKDWNESSTDQNQGWIGTKVSLSPGVTKEIDLAFAGGYDTSADFNCDGSVDISDFALLVNTYGNTGDL